MLTPEQLENWESDGFVYGIRIADDDEAAATRRQWDALEAEERLKERDVNRIHSRHFDLRFVWDIAASPVLLDCVEQLLGPNVLLFGSRFFCKYGPDEKFVSWHQDVYPKTWGLEPPVAATAWYAIDDTDPENGCMYMIPGSHRRGLLDHQPSGRDGNLLRLDQEIAVGDEDERRAVPVPLKAGEVSIHNGMTVHCSGANRSTRRRCGLAVRFVPTYVRQRPGNPDQPHARALLVRGEDVEQNFGTHELPFPLETRPVAGVG